MAARKVKRGRRVAQWRRAILWVMGMPCDTWAAKIRRLAPVPLLSLAIRGEEPLYELARLVGRTDCACLMCGGDEARRKLRALAKKGPRAIVAAAKKIGWKP